jgi:hypothetical protein
MNASSFTSKQLRVTISLAQPNAVFPGTTGNTLILGPDSSGNQLRVIANVQAVARLSVMAEIKIFGVLPADMNALTVAWFNSPVVQNNIVILEANNGNGWTQVFSGTIIEAQPDYRGQPAAFFRIQANVSYAAQLAPVPPLSYPHGASVATIVQALATQMGFTFENNGVTATVPPGSYYPGTAYDQLQTVCQATDTDFYFSGKTLAIVPSGLGRPNVPAVLLTQQSGLQGYPVIERFGITIYALFDPNFAGGGQVQISGSDIPAANGTWTPFSLTHQLESQNPNGAWLTTLSCTKYGAGVPDEFAS